MNMKIRCYTKHSLNLSQIKLRFIFSNSQILFLKFKWKSLIYVCVYISIYIWKEYTSAFLTTVCWSKFKLYYYVPVFVLTFGMDFLNLLLTITLACVVMISNGVTYSVESLWPFLSYENGHSVIMWRNHSSNQDASDSTKSTSPIDFYPCHIAYQLYSKFSLTQCHLFIEINATTPK